MEELDRRIGVEVMGEPEPAELPEEQLDADLWPSRSEQGNWWCTLETGWTPLPFSKDFSLAMRAVDRVLANTQEHNRPLKLHYVRHLDGMAWVVWLFDDHCAVGSTLPEAICRLLLALKSE